MRQYCQVTALALDTRAGVDEGIPHQLPNDSYRAITGRGCGPECGQLLRREQPGWRAVKGPPPCSCRGSLAGLPAPYYSYPSPVRFLQARRASPGTPRGVALRAIPLLARRARAAGREANLREPDPAHQRAAFAPSRRYGAAVVAPGPQIIQFGQRGNSGGAGWPNVPHPHRRVATAARIHNNWWFPDARCRSPT